MPLESGRKHYVVMDDTRIAPVAVTASRSLQFHEPRPSRLLMWLLGLVNRWCLLKGLPGLRRIPLVRDLPLVRGHFRIQTVEIPTADRVRLARAVNPNTAAFIGPNHPEFGLDWMMDKEISTFVAPHMASWAAHGIVRSAPRFWTKNNLVANDGGAAATEYSVNWALKGRGVLLHPEGSVRWTSNRVHPLYHGIAEMATEAARRAAASRTGRPVYIVPIVWKYHYSRDVSPRIHREIDLIERELQLDRSNGSSVSERFRALHENILNRQMKEFRFDPGSVAGLHFFVRQEAFRAHLVDELESRYAIEPIGPLERRIGRLARVIAAALKGLRGGEDAERKATLVRDLAAVKEAGRLSGFSRDAYNTPVLTQEQVFECLKRIRADLVGRGIRNTLHNFLPTPYGPRVAHIRVPDPILIDAERASGGPSERKAYVVWLIEQAGARMQSALDGINRAIASEVDPFSHPNPFKDERSLAVLTARLRPTRAVIRPSRETRTILISDLGETGLSRLSM